MHAGSDDGPAGVRVVRGGQGGGALQPGQQVGRVGGIQAGQGEPHRQRVAVQPVQQFPERPALPPRLRGRVRGEQVAGVLGGLGPVQPAHADPADLAQPALLRAAGDDHRAARSGRAPSPGSSCSAAQPASSSGGVAPAGSGISRTDSKLSHTSSTRYCAEQLLHRGQPLGRVQAGEVGAEHGQADPGDHPVQAEGGDAGLERMPEHQPRVIHPAGVPPPPGEPLGQLASSPSPPDRPAPPPAAAGPRSPAGRTGHRGPRTRRPPRPAGPAAAAGSDGGGADLVQRLIQRRRRGRAGGAGLREADVLAQVVHRDQPVGQRHVPFRARPPVMLEQPPPPGGDRLAHAVPGEQGLVERGHELRRGDRVHAVGHRHHRRAPRLQQRGGDRGFQLLADRAGLARVQHRHRHPPLGQHRRDLRRRHKVTAAAGLLERQHPLARAGHHRRPAPRRPATAGAAGHHPVPVEMHHMKRLTRQRPPAVTAWRSASNVGGRSTVRSTSPRTASSRSSSGRATI